MIISLKKMRTICEWNKKYMITEPSVSLVGNESKNMKYKGI